MSVHRQYFPDEEDETGAAKALMRLQDTYQLDSEAFSRGKLPGNQNNQEIHEYINNRDRRCFYLQIVLEHFFYHKVTLSPPRLMSL